MNYHLIVFGLILGGALTGCLPAHAGDPRLGVDLSLPGAPDPGRGIDEDAWHRPIRRGLTNPRGETPPAPFNTPARPSRTRPNAIEPPGVETSPSRGPIRPDFSRAGVSCPSYVSDLIHGKDVKAGRDPMNSGLECLYDLGLSERPRTRPAARPIPGRTGVRESSQRRHRLAR